MIPLLLAMCCTIATFLGGSFALRFTDYKHYIVSLAGGMVLSMAFLDLIPSAISLYGNAQTVLGVGLIGFLIYLGLNSILPMTSHTCECDNLNHRATLGAGLLSIHSWTDGFILGVSWIVSPILGLGVALALIGHDVADGCNVISAVIRNNGVKNLAWKWLYVDALMPIVGVICAFCIKIPDKTLGLILALTGGIFMFIGSEMLTSENHHSHSKFWNIVLTLVGASIIFVIVRLGG